MYILFKEMQNKTRNRACVSVRLVRYLDFSFVPLKMLHETGSNLAAGRIISMPLKYQHLGTLNDER